MNKDYTYISEVKIEASPGGSMLLNRIFKLLDKKGDWIYILYSADKEKNNKNFTLNFPFGKLNQTRFRKWYNFICFQILWILPLLTLVLRKKPGRYIFTVSHGIGYKVAYYYSKIYKRPLLVFHHDLYTNTFAVPDRFKKRVGEWFKSTLEYCKANYYVSPFMEEFLGVKGTVIYPFREIDSNSFLSKRNSSEKLNFCIAGSVHSREVLENIKVLALSLSAIGAELHLFTNLRRKDFPIDTYHNVVIKGIKPVDEFRIEIKENIDVLVLIQNFEIEESEAQMTNFPSKLADYTLFGLPILFVAPKYASSIKWIDNNNLDIGFQINNLNQHSFNSVIKDIQSNLEGRNIKGANAYQAGRNYFLPKKYIKLIEGCLND